MAWYNYLTILSFLHKFINNIESQLKLPQTKSIASQLNQTPYEKLFILRSLQAEFTRMRFLKFGEINQCDDFKNDNWNYLKVDLDEFDIQFDGEPQNL